MEVLRTKNTDARPPLAACLDTYTDNLPDMVSVNIIDDVMLAVAGPL